MANSKCRWQCPEDWAEWSQWLAAGLHARNRWRLPVLLVGILFAHGRRTVTTWLRAAGVSDDFQDYYYFLAALGRKTKSVATQLLVLVLADLAAARSAAGGHRRHAHQAVRSEGRRGRHPSQPHAGSGRPKVSLRTHLGDALAGRAASAASALWPCRCGPCSTSAAKRWPRFRKWRGWTFATKLVLAARLVEWIAPIVKQAGKTLWIVVDGGYVKAPFLKRALRAGVTVIGRLRKDAALRDLPPKLRRGQRRGRGRPPKYGKNKISLAKRAAHRNGWETAKCTVYGKTVTKLYKTFLATYRPAGGVIRVVIVEEDHDWYPFFSTDPNATAVEIIEAFADRATIEQDFHDVKEVWGAGQQQVRNIWTNLAVYHLNLWIHTLVELWSWNRPHDELCDRSLSPWDDADRRPSHADRRKALRRQIMEHELSTLAAVRRLPRKILQLTKRLMTLAA